MEKKIIKNIVWASLIIFTLYYGCFSFMQWEYHPAEWNVKVRVFFVMIWFFTSLAIAGAIIDEDL